MNILVLLPSALAALYITIQVWLNTNCSNTSAPSAALVPLYYIRTVLQGRLLSNTQMLVYGREARTHTHTTHNKSSIKRQSRENTTGWLEPLQMCKYNTQQQNEKHHQNPQAPSETDYPITRGKAILAAAVPYTDGTHLNPYLCYVYCFQQINDMPGFEWHLFSNTPLIVLVLQ